LIIVKFAKFTFITETLSSLALNVDILFTNFLSEASLLYFFGYWQMVVSFVACLALLAIWWHIGRMQKDTGQIWLALSVLCWSFSGGLEVYHATQIDQDRASIYQNINDLLGEDTFDQLAGQTGANQIKELRAQYTQYKEQAPKAYYQIEGWKSILSLFNSLFILLALPWFKYIPARLQHLVKSKTWYYIIGIPFLFALVPTISKMLSGNSLALISELDVYYSILTLIFLGAILWESFIKRRLNFLAWITLAVILFTFIAQVFKLSATVFDLVLISAIFKTSLIMLFFALAMSWVKELSLNLIPEAHNLFLSFLKQKNAVGKFENLVFVKGLPGTKEREVALSSGNYNLLHKFAQVKIENENPWLEIKPKNEQRVSKEYDIKDHNEVKRLLNALLDGLFGKDKWSKEQHYLPLKDSLFEMSEARERKIRLKIPSVNLKL